MICRIRIIYSNDKVENYLASYLSFTKEFLSFTTIEGIHFYVNRKYIKVVEINAVH